MRITTTRYRKLLKGLIQTRCKFNISHGIFRYNSFLINIMRRKIFYPQNPYPQHQPIDRAKNLTEKDFNKITEHIDIKPGMSACLELSRTISNAFTHQQNLTEEEKINISKCIKIYRQEIKKFKSHPYENKSKNMSELMTAFGKATHLALTAPKGFFWSISIVDLLFFVKNLFELGNTNSDYSLDKVSGMAAVLRERLDEEKIERVTYVKMMRLLGGRTDIKIGLLKLAIETKVKTYFADMARHYPNGTTPEIFAPLRAEGKILCGNSANDKTTDATREQKFEGSIKPLLFDNNKLNAYFEYHKHTINYEIIVLSYTLSQRIKKEVPSSAIADDLKTTIELISKYCDYYIEETSWYQNDEIHVTMANKAYLFRLRKFIENNISVMFDLNTRVIKNSVNRDFKIDKDSFKSIVNGRIHEDALMEWAKYTANKNPSLDNENGDSGNAFLEKNSTFKNIYLISPINIYPLESAISELMYKILEQINKNSLIQKTSLEDEKVSKSQIALPETTTPTHQEESKSISPDIAKTTISTDFSTEKPGNDSAILTSRSTATSKTETNNAKIVKVKNLSASKNKMAFKAEDAWEKVRRDYIYKDDLTKLRRPGGEIWLEGGDAAIGRLWQTEDRRKTTISYSSSAQAEAYTLFSEELLANLSKQLTNAQFKAFMDDVEIKAFLKSGHKVQGIIKIKGEDAYEIRLTGGERAYRVVLKQMIIANQENKLFQEKTIVFVAIEIFFHNGKTDKTIAKLNSDSISKITNTLISGKLYLKPSAHLDQ